MSFAGLAALDDHRQYLKDHNIPFEFNALSMKVKIGNVWEPIANPDALGGFIQALKACKRLGKV